MTYKGKESEKEYTHTHYIRAIYIFFYMGVLVLSCFNSIWLFVTHELYPARLLCSWDSLGKNTGMGCHFLLQEIFLTQGSNPGLLHCRQIPYQLSYKGSLKWRRSICFSGILLYSPWSIKGWHFDLWFLCLFETQFVHLEILGSCTAEG